MPEKAWKEYFEKTKNSKARPLLIKAVKFLKEKDNALDLGSGAFNDVNFLLSIGFNHLVAVDKVSVAEDIYKNLLSTKVSYLISRFEDCEFHKNNYDLVNAQFSLPFIGKESFDRVYEEIVNSLKPGGVFTGQFFGDRDEWNTVDTKMTFHAKNQAEKLLQDLKVIEFTEEEKDGITAMGKPKHWHIFHFIAVK
jgi:SAM-dependent methyltransferase